MGRFATASGQLIDINDLTPDQIHLDDIAHHLAKIQRFGGASPIDVYYCVGEHSINIYNHLKTNGMALYPGGMKLLKMTLLHDASEIYLADVVSPVKANLKDYLELEEQVQTMIYEKYLGRISPHDVTALAVYDKRILIDEVESIFPDKKELYERETGLKKLGCHIEFNNHPSTVKKVFLNICKSLGISD